MSCLAHQTSLIEAAVLIVGLCQPDVTELLLPFHSDDVIFWTCFLAHFFISYFFFIFNDLLTKLFIAIDSAHSALNFIHFFHQKLFLIFFFLLISFNFNLNE
jgi:hypothetical protein